MEFKSSCFDDTKFYNYHKFENETAATKRTVFSPNSATTKRQLTFSTTDSNIK